MWGKKRRLRRARSMNLRPSKGTQVAIGRTQPKDQSSVAQKIDLRGRTGLVDGRSGSDVISGRLDQPPLTHIIECAESSTFGPKRHTRDCNPLG